MPFLGFGKKKVPDRYDGKPFLKFVDAFVLKCIDALDPSQEALLEQMTPSLQKTFNHSGAWDEIVIAQLHFPPDIRQIIKNMWINNQDIAVENNVTLQPMQFVEMFVSSNVTCT